MPVPPPFAERLVAGYSCRDREPFLTVAVPHYKHRAYLEKVLQTLFEQTCDDFEIVISDDCSPDDSNTVLPALLKASGKPFRYYAQPKNLGYDGNVRFCLSSALGRYVMLLGNDDAIGPPDTLQKIIDALQELGLPAVAFTDYEDWASHERAHRASRTALLGSGPEVALTHFRTFSFVSGLIYDGQWAHRLDTDRWDRSVYYQIYLAARIITDGGQVAALDVSAVRKDVRINSQTVPNVNSKLAIAKWDFSPRHSGLDNVIRVTLNAILQGVRPHEKSSYARRIISQVLIVNYGFWLLTYRRNGNWAVAVGLARGMWPGIYLGDAAELNYPDRLRLWYLYGWVTLAGLTAPTGLLGMARSVAKKLRRTQQARTAASAQPLQPDHWPGDGQAALRANGTSNT